MAKIGIMVEGQEGATWESFLRVAEAVEALGFESLFRSDHLTALDHFPERPSLELWSSLTALALRTSRLRFGPLVCPMTFRHPAELAKLAAAVDRLSGGRLDLGIGAGWFPREHRMFGIPYPPYAARLEMLDEGAQVLRLLWSGQPATFKGRHYQLEAAETHPVPVQSPLPLILGGKNEAHGLRLVAQHASEWNCSYASLEVFRRKSAVLDAHCAALGRDPASLPRSMMIPFAVAPTEAGLRERLAAHRRVFPSLPADPDAWRAQGFIGGSPAQVAGQLHERIAAGVSRFMLQHNDLADLDSLELLATRVLPQVA